MNKLLARTGIVIVILVVIFLIGKKAGWLGDGDVLKVTVDTVKLHTITEIVSANGKVQPEVEVKMSSDVSGEVVELFVKEGGQVIKGQLLAKINPKIYQSLQEQAAATLNSSKSNFENSKAGVLQAQAQLEKAESAYKRNKQLFDQGVISQADFEIIKSAYDVAKAALESAKQLQAGAQFGVTSAQASLQQSLESLNKTSVYAPVNGTISKLSVERGERVVGTSQFTGTELMRIANLNEMEVIVDVSENDIVRVSLNDTARIEIDAYNERTFSGIVTEIANTANTATGLSTDQVTNFTVKIRILRESYADLVPKDSVNLSPFRPGMSATVDIETKKVTNVPAVPIQAVTTRDTSAKAGAKKTRAHAGDETTEKQSPETAKKDKMNEVVFVAAEGKAVMKVVKTGVQDNNYIQIIAGLKTGEPVISGPYNTVNRELKNGDKVKVVDKKELFSDKE